ncbi:hypothetical protein GQR91_06025 [Sphingomonas carotinifaciens]|uniref:Uncharacterized protein n=1 Tax=Sphingomonas carotinifaciens TaxID=1166323 RepID=A0A6N8LQE6_9SPHN|nr:hypothetical protein [Sphingomonas carotinifaciens]
MAAVTEVEFLMMASRLLRHPMSSPTRESPFASVPIGSSSRRHRPVDEAVPAREPGIENLQIEQARASLGPEEPWTCTPAPRPKSLSSGRSATICEVLTPRSACWRTAPLYAEDVNRINRRSEIAGRFRATRGGPRYFRRSVALGKWTHTVTADFTLPQGCRWHAGPQPT